MTVEQRPEQERMLWDLFRQNIQSDDRWYLSQHLGGQVLDTYYYVQQKGKMIRDTEMVEWGPETNLMYKILTEELANDRLAIEQGREFYNDQTFHKGSDRLTWDREPVTHYVVHHTTFPPESGLHDSVGAFRDVYDKVNALHMMRSWLMYHRGDPGFQDNGKPVPLASGHFTKARDGRRRPTFVNYNHLVVAGEPHVVLADPRYIGLHASNLRVNRQSIGGAFGDNLTDKMPADADLDAMAYAINDVNTMNKYLGHGRVAIVGHRDVPQPRQEWGSGLTVPTACPGNYWQEIVGELQARVDRKPREIRYYI